MILFKPHRVGILFFYLFISYLSGLLSPASFDDGHPTLKGLSYSGHSVDSSRVAEGDQVKLRDKENKIKVVRGETGGGGGVKAAAM